MSPTGHITSSAKHGSGEDKTETRLNFEHAACSFGKGRCLAIVRWHSQFMSCRNIPVNPQYSSSAASRPSAEAALYCARLLPAPRLRSIAVCVAKLRQAPNGSRPIRVTIAWRIKQISSPSLRVHSKPHMRVPDGGGHRTKYGPEQRRLDAKRKSSHQLARMVGSKRHRVA